MSRPDSSPATAASAALHATITPTSAVSEVTRRLLDYFTSGAIAKGDRLPPERQLAASMGVGRSAIREALAALEILGVVSVRPGSGTYLRGGASDLLPQTLSWGVLLGEPRTRELIEIRYALEVHAARVAARSIDPDGLARLDADLTQMQADQGDFARFVSADLDFHQTLAEATGNELLDGLLQSVRALLRVWVDRSVSDTDHTATTCAEHAAILDALRDGDAERAAAAMRTHMDSAGARLLAALG